MNNYINYYYNLYPHNINEKNGMHYFFDGNEKYYFMPFNRPAEEANHLYELNTQMIKNGSLVHEIIPNKDKYVLTFVDSDPYILMRIYINEEKKIDLPEIVSISVFNNIKKNKILDRSDWASLWGSKVDYFEYQISQVGKKYPIVCEYLGYYIGLAENAIMYAKNTTTQLSPTMYDNLAVAHKRIREDDTLFELYNPLSFIMDYQIRDISEYIKAKFFSGKDIWEELDTYFRNYDLSIYSRRLLYARLLFPSYFFDVYEDVVEGKLKEDNILSIIGKSSSYELFLDEIYIYLNKDRQMPPIAWINNRNN